MPQPAPPEIRAEHVRKEFGPQVVLEDVDLEILRGQIVAIVGGSGSGKTVLMSILAGLMPPTSGRVEVADHSRQGAPLADLSTLNGDQLDAVRMHWAVVFQRNALFSGSVYENIALLLREHERMPESKIRKRAREALAAVSLDPDLIMDRDRDNLSGGMAKRVAIARAIAIDPELIFYDEPTTGLDPVVGGQIHELIFNTHHRPTASGVPRTTVLVTHDKDLLRRVRPRVVMLHEAKVVYSGEYDAFTKVDEGPPHEYMRAMPVLHARK